MQACTQAHAARHASEGRHGCTAAAALFNRCPMEATAAKQWPHFTECGQLVRARLRRCLVVLHCPSAVARRLPLSLMRACRTLRPPVTAEPPAAARLHSGTPKLLLNEASDVRLADLSMLACRLHGSNGIRLVGILDGMAAPSATAAAAAADAAAFSNGGAAAAAASPAASAAAKGRFRFSNAQGGSLSVSR